MIGVGGWVRPKDHVDERIGDDPAVTVDIGDHVLTDGGEQVPGMNQAVADEKFRTGCSPKAGLVIHAAQYRAPCKGLPQARCTAGVVAS